MGKLLKSLARGCAFLVFSAGVATPARAALITDPQSLLVLNTDPAFFYQQTTSSPCVIGGDSCQNPAGFPFTDAASGGGGTESNYTSPLYTAAQIAAISGGAGFTFGLDYNEASGDQGGPQTLRSFEAFYYTGTTFLSSQLFDVVTGLPTNNNGVGYSDFLLSGFTVPLAATNVQFQAKWYNNDGPDRYFIVAPDSQPCQVNCTQAPEPASFALFGMTAVAAAFVRRRKKQKDTNS